MSAWHQVRALVALRWRLVRSRAIRLGLLLLLALVPLLGWLMVVARTGVDPAALVAALHTTPAAFLGFGALAVIAPLTAGGGNELVPSDQLVAYPIRPATLFLSSLVLAPVNLVWVIQLLVLTAETGFLTLGTPSLARGAVTTVLYVVACTGLGQAVAWTTVGLRRTQRGRHLLRAALAVLAVTVLTVVRTGHGNDVVRSSFAPAVVHAVTAGGDGDLAGWLPVTITLALVALGSLVAGGRACRWSLRRPGDRGSQPSSRPVRRRQTPRTPLAALVAVDRASVWRAPALRRGALVLAVLPGLAAAGIGLPWKSLVFLPGLVAAGAGLLFGFNAFCLDASGAVWVASLPHPPGLVIRAKARVTAEVVLVGVLLVAGMGSVRALGTPTPTELVALVASAITCCALVVALCLSAAVRRPYRADLNGPRDSVAPPGALVLASTRLAMPAAVVGLLLEGTSEGPHWWLPLAVAAPIAGLSAAWIAASMRKYDDPLRRSRIVQVVSAG
ncbi:MAG: hypothetical protein WCD35_00905 [Mycobacteriales bacterium]